MHASKPKAKKHYGIDINRYLGVENPEDRISTSQQHQQQSRRTSRNRTSSAFRRSLAKMYPNNGNKSSGSIHRWNSKSSTPLVDRSNTQRTASTADTSSFLPELYSTPPMPTFQKPDMMTPTPLRKAHNLENETPTRGATSRRSVTDTSPMTPEITINSSGPSRSMVSRPLVRTSFSDRITETPPLPSNWTDKHDRAICVLDARNYSLPATVSKVRRTFPELKGTLTPGMVDKRLRQLDQNVEIDYWRIGLRKEDDKDRNKTLSPPSFRRQESSTTLGDMARSEGGKSPRSPL